FFVSTDSAPLHIAAALGIPTIALFGPTDPSRHMPPGEKMIPLYQKVDCGPCYKSYCHHDFTCMKKIGPDIVIEKQKELLGRVS
ncbi:MAG: glycosyltransferase family 9 protein, partial [Deltaproteobacteria bacterium]